MLINLLSLILDACLLIFVMYFTPVLSVLINLNFIFKSYLFNKFDNSICATLFMCLIHKVDFSIGHLFYLFTSFTRLLIIDLLFHTRLIGSCCHAAQLLDVNGESKMVFIPVVVAVSSCLPFGLDSYPVCIFTPRF